MREFKNGDTVKYPYIDKNGKQAFRNFVVSHDPKAKHDPEYVRVECSFAKDFYIRIADIETAEHTGV